MAFYNVFCHSVMRLDEEAKISLKNKGYFHLGSPDD